MHFYTQAPTPHTLSDISPWYWIKTVYTRGQSATDFW